MCFSYIKEASLLIGLFIGFHFNTTAQSTLYARANGNWSDATAGTGTWSLAGPGGVACACAPTANDSVVIGAFTVTLTVDGDCKSLSILSGGTLSVNSNRGLDINNSGTVHVATNGTVTHSGLGSNAHFDFEAGENSLLLVDSAASFSLDDLQVETNDTLELTGKGDIYLTDDLLIVGTNSLITNNLEGNLNLTGNDNSSIWFRPGASNCTFINNGKLTIDRYLYVESTGHHFINNDTVIISRNTRGINLIGNTAHNTTIDNYGYFFVEGEFHANTSIVTFNNYGVFDINGDFRGFNGPGSVYNFDHAIIKWAGDFDNNALRLYCDYDSSVFIYDGANPQPDLFDPQDNYVHLVLENSGSKRYHNSFTVKGNMIVNAPLVVESGLRYLYFDSAATLVVNHGGSVTQTGGVGRLQCTSGHDYSITIHDTVNGFNWQRLIIDTNVNLTLNGDGPVRLSQPSAINFTGNSSSCINNLTDTLSVTGITFLSTCNQSTFTNNGYIVSSADLIYNGMNNTFNNNGYYSLGDDLTYANTGNTFNGSIASTLTLGDEIQFYSDSSTLYSGGTLLVSDQLLFNARNCSLIVNGNMNIANTFRVINSTMDNNVTHIQSTGSLTINSYMQLDDTDFILKNEGTLTLAGAFDDFGGNDSIINMTGGTINYGGIHNIALNSEIGLYCNYFGSTFNYTRNDGMTQEVIGPRDAYHHLTLSGSGNKTALGDLTINGDLRILGTAAFDINTNTANLEVGGGWENSGSFVGGTQTVTFSGTNSGTLSGSSKTQFYDLIIDRNTSGNALTLTTRAEVQNSLTLTQGIVSTATNSELILLDNIVCSEGNDSAFVSGPVMKIGDDPFVFPLGDGTLWARLELADLINGPAITDTFTAAYYRDRHTESFWDSLDYPGDPGGMKNVSIVEYWDLQRVSGTAQPRVILHWENGDSSYINNLPDLTIAHYIGGSAWEAIPSSTSGSVAAGTITTGSQITTFSPFTFGSFNKNVNPLPVGLTHFSGTQLNQVVELNWRTETEVNNDYFLVERSIDGNNFEQIGKAKGHGNTTQPVSYALTDAFPSNGYNYYRLKQVDFNGQEHYSNLIAVRYSADNDVLLYPNPVSKTAYVRLGNALTGALIHIELRTLKGTLQLEFDTQGQELLIIPVGTLTPGNYLLIITTSEQRYVKQLSVGIP